jgi:hypothetical protein
VEEEPGTIQLSQSEETVYFASQGKGMSLLEVGIVIDLIGVSLGRVDEQLYQILRSRRWTSGDEVDTGSNLRHNRCR